MTVKAKQFNDKYNLNISDASFKAVKADPSLSNELAGKPKKNWIEVFKRFATNKVAMISFIVFLVIVLMAIIIPYTNPFTPDKNVAPSILPSFTRYAPPTSSGTRIDWLTDTQYNSVTSFIKANPTQSVNIGMKEIGTLSSMHHISWNPWAFIHGAGGITGNSVIGTDTNGFDVWTRTWAGTWSSLKTALLVATITMFIGTVIGSWIGYYVGSIVDILFMKIIAIYGSIPTVVWFTLITFLLPKGYWSLIILMIVTQWTRGLGLSRQYMWKYVNSTSMKAAETMNVSRLGRIFKHALPNYLGIMALTFVSAIPVIIEIEASLALLGFSPTAATDATLGNVLNEAKGALAGGSTEHVWLILLPTITIFTITISLKFVALGLNDALDPKFMKRS